MKKLAGIIREETERIKEEIISLRRYFHQNPELGFEEYKACEKISSVLEKAGIPCSRMAKTGVTGYLGGRGNVTIGLRADMDALPVEEKTGLPFSSANKGLMHACGHDGHMAVVLGTALVLKKIEKDLEVNVKLVFQPSEERPPGGAAAMISQGVLDDVDFMLGFHFFPTLPLYDIWVGQGPVMANADFFSIKITGRGGHGASPHATDDPLACAAYLVTGLQSIVSRKIDPVKPAVISVCGISGGTAYNVIPEEVVLKGTVRTLEDSVQARVRRVMEEMAENVCRSHGCSAEFKYDTYVPSCINDIRFSEEVRKRALGIWDPGRITEHHPVMGGEDFAFFSRKKPSCYIFMGIGDRFGDNHSSNFSIDERALPYASEFFSSLLAGMKTAVIPPDAK